MNYEFKMIAVVLALGMFVLQGCVTVTNSYDRTSSYNRTGNSYYMYNRQADEIANMTDKKLMGYACNNGLWRKSNSDHVIEAKKRFLDCEIEGVANTFSVLNSSSKTNSLTSMQRRIVNYVIMYICVQIGKKAIMV